MKKSNFIVIIGIILLGYLIYPTIIFENDFLFKVLNLQGFNKHYELLKIVNSFEIYNTLYIYIAIIILYYSLISISIKYKERENFLYEDIFYLSVYAIFLFYLLNDWYDYYVMYTKPEFKFTRQYLYDNFVFERKLSYIWLLIPAIINNSKKYSRINIIFIAAILINGLITKSRFEVFAMVVLILGFSNFKDSTKKFYAILGILVVAFRVLDMDLNKAMMDIAWEPISYRISYLYERLSDPVYVGLHGFDILPPRTLSRAGLLDILNAWDKVFGLFLIIALSAYFFRFANFILPNVIATSFFKAYRGGLNDAFIYTLKYVTYLLIIYFIYKIYIKIKEYKCTM